MGAKSESKIKSEVLLRTQIIANFEYSLPPANDNEKLARAVLDANLEEATRRIQNAMRALLMEMVDILQTTKK